MAGPVQTERFLLVIELLDLRPRYDAGQLRVARRTACCVRAAEQVRLPEILVALRPCAVFARRIDRGEKLRAHMPERAAFGLPGVGDERIGCARFDEGFEHALVGQSQIENLAERVQRRNTAAELLARLQERVDRAFAQSLDRGQAETDALTGFDGKTELALVDIRRQ